MPVEQTISCHFGLERDRAGYLRERLDRSLKITLLVELLALLLQARYSRRHGVCEGPLTLHIHEKLDDDA